jgi:hypothetical protein
LCEQLFALIDRGLVFELAGAYIDAIGISPADHSSIQAAKARRFVVCFFPRYSEYYRHLSCFVLFLLFFVFSISLIGQQHAVYPTQAYLRIEFLHVLCDTEYGVHLSMPIAASPLVLAAISGPI